MESLDALQAFRSFRTSFYECLDRRSDAIFELTDALLCAEAVPSPVHLSLQASHRRGWGSLYAALEHTFRFLKQTFGWSSPRFRQPEQADRWTWLVVVAAFTQLRLARASVADMRLPWERR